ncbi:twin-arginine translocase subunit TatC [Streptomyces gilvosporeus]|uniref:Sec-independent protein translocase protein TatC n=2 Tax=Streptomyces gilvosporeus TaxID=553510 RepID=A0A1V0TNJ2_9ACTN|nr:twin-arginine translocase subunit TatC [Streptomyces gilvosporeus]ARF54507.1 twin arginine-targeting protein translocase TatC [Streptomyces gilvosporeus]
MRKSAPNKRAKEKDPEGRMPLVEHLRELRNRLAKAVLAIVIATIIAAFFYEAIINFFTKPVLQSVGCHSQFTDIAKLDKGQRCANIVMLDLLGPFTLALKVSLVAGVVLSSPIWLYQLWAFLAPGLHRHEKKYTLSFVAAGFPLFAAGAYFAYWTLPTTAKVLTSFTPAGVGNLLQLDNLLDLITRMVIVFGLSFELPLLLMMLNFAGLITGKRMLGWWRGMVMGITVFAAVATPSTDPLTMLALAVPIAVLYFVAVGIALSNDARRKRRDETGPADDEASELDLTPEDIGELEPVTAPRALTDGSEAEGRGGYDDVT